MRIYYSAGQDPMLLETLTEMNALHDRLKTFVASTQTEIALLADRSGPALPHSEMLAGLKLQKGDGPLNLSLMPDQWLVLTGSAENMVQYVKFFHFNENEDGAHHHPEYVQKAGYMAKGTLSLIIEVD